MKQQHGGYREGAGKKSNREKGLPTRKQVYFWISVTEERALKQYLVQMRRQEEQRSKVKHKNNDEWSSDTLEF
jgi:hypothetical protein